ncbi:programmed cell death protein 1-like isoform X2 [Oxyura jamaicensis]|uniref:programmed cell death protein 1-like isoform X2 n=1 Tax=Oxyura jamaicensis TaxID=8884 RepID=UPI0015A6423B|nr:programmed cell death protein 1-like isoform X2 [Oxyura jamaicensis]XP_035168047.1 programmed cell death protein 1-like isoform X2 [Oxyura jamaicensis]
MRGMGDHHLRVGWELQGALTLFAAQDLTRGTSASAARCHRVISLLLLSPTVTFSPATLTRPAGGSATFFCNISIENNSSLEYNLNWYKETNHSDAQKIAQISRSIPQTKTEKYLLSNHAPVFKIEILNLHQNDSGSYYCGLIAFFQPNKVEESNRSHLVVTAPEKINTTEEPGVEDSSPPSHIKAVILGVLLLGCVVVLVVLGYCVVTYRRGGGEPGDPYSPCRGAGGVTGDLGGDISSSNPAGTRGQMDMGGARRLVCHAQTQAWLVPVGQASPCWWDKGAQGPARPPAHVLRLCTSPWSNA